MTMQEEEGGSSAGRLCTASSGNKWCSLAGQLHLSEIPTEPRCTTRLHPGLWSDSHPGPGPASWRPFAWWRTGVNLCGRRM